MSSSPPTQTPEPDMQAHIAKVTAHMTYHIMVPGNASVMILLKHGEDKYNITKKMTYGIKVQLPGVNKMNSLDIENLSEYQDLVTSIIEGLPNKMNIYIDMTDIQKRRSGRGSQGSGNEDGDGEEAGLYNGDGLTDLERELARLRGKLEKHWQNDHDAGYTYIDPRTGSPTVTKPSKFIAVFDPANRQVVLHPARIAAGVNKLKGAGTENNGVVEVIGHLATMNGYGPDIMHLVDNQDLVELGMSKGDVIRLKAGSQLWWNGPTAKRKQSQESITYLMSGSSGTITPFPPFGDAPTTPPSKKVAFERRYDDGGAERFHGPTIVPGDDMGEVWYRCPVHNTWGPVPLGYRSVVEEEGLASDEEELDLHKQAEKVAENEQATKADTAAVLAGLRNA
ncbi:hypothetical protein DFH09DRAFT_1072470 [Mycena vulgaris]|nr:hypothetical protein DFH09DRAFT_1072470 [Mycena vulgaris]